MKHIVPSGRRDAGATSDLLKIPNPSLEIRDLRVVLAVAAAGSTAQAANLLHLTQPAVSRALLAVEAKLQMQLFDRSPRGLVPSPLAQPLFEEAKRLLLELSDLERRVSQPLQPCARLRLVCECYTAYHWLPSALSGLRAHMPGLEITLALEHSAAPVAALSAGQIDVALLTTAEVPIGELQERALFGDEIVFLVSRNHPLAERKALSRRDLYEHTLLSSNPPEGELRWFAARVFGQKPKRLPRFERLPLTEPILDMTRAGMGIGVLSEWIAGPHLMNGDLIAKRLKSGPLRRPWRIAYRREVGQAVERLRPILESLAPRAAVTH